MGCMGVQLHEKKTELDTSTRLSRDIINYTTAKKHVRHKNQQHMTICSEK